MIRISTVQDEKACRDAAGRYVTPTCRVYGLRLRSTLLQTSGDIGDIGDDDEIPEN